MKKTSSTTGIMNSSDLKLARYKCLYGFFIAFLVIACLISVLPTLWVVLSALKSTQEIYSIPATFFPKKIDVAGVAEVLKDLNITSNIICTFILSVLETLSMILVCGLGGYVFSKLRTKGMGILFMLVVWTMMVPGTMRLVPLYMTFVDFPVFHVSLLNTYIPMCLLAAANSFNVVLFKNFFDTIPKAYIEAARIDGCTSMRIFFSIILPLSLPILVVVSIFSFNSSWNSFIWPYLILTENHLNTMSIFLFKSQAANHPIDSYMIMLIFSILPPTIIFIILQKQIIGGLSIGGVKG